LVPEVLGLTQSPLLGGGLCQKFYLFVLKPNLPKSSPKRAQVPFCGGVAAQNGIATLPGEVATNLSCLQVAYRTYK